MIRPTVVILAVIASVGCKRKADVFSDRYAPADMRAGFCLRVKDPPRDRCAVIVKEAIAVIEQRNVEIKANAPDVACWEVFEALKRFAPASPDAARLKAACCNYPDWTITRNVMELCGKPDKAQK